MAYALRATATAVSGFNTALTPGLPAGTTAGDLLLLCTGSYMGSLSTPAVTGWTQLSPGTNANQQALYGRIATGSDSASISWGNQFAYAFITGYTGGPSSLTGIVHASADKLNLSTNNIGYPALTITQANCLVIAGGGRDKTATTNGATFASTFGSFTQRNAIVLNSTSIAGVMNDWIQTTATSLAAAYQSFSAADASSQQFEGYVVALLPAAASNLTLTSANGTFTATGGAATLSTLTTAYTLVANTGVYSDAFAPNQNDYQIDCPGGTFVSMGGNASFAFPFPYQGPSRDPLTIGHWKHQRTKELAKLRRIEMALRRRRGEIEDEPPEEPEEEEQQPLPTIRANASGMAETKIDLSELLAASGKAKPPQPDLIAETPGQKAVREYAEMIQRAKRLVPAVRAKRDKVT